MNLPLNLILRDLERFDPDRFDLERFDLERFDLLISVRASSKKLIEWIAYPLRLTMRLELALTEMISKAPLGSI